MYEIDLLIISITIITAITIAGIVTTGLYKKLKRK